MRLLILTLFLSSGTFGQVQIYILDFESSGGYTTSVPEISDGSGDYFTRTDGSNINATFTNVQGSSYFAAQDIDGVAANSDQSLSITGLSISGYTNLELRVFLAEDDDGSNQDWDANSELIINYAIDGGTVMNGIHVQSAGGTNTEPRLDNNYDGIGEGASITDVFQQFSSPVLGTGSIMTINININGLDAGDEDIAIDNIEIWGNPSTPTCLLSSINLSNTSCNDNTTSSDGTDDFITFELNPIGSNLGSTYSVAVSSGTVSPTAATYGSATTFTLQNGSAGAGDVDVTITDDDDVTCSITETIVDPGICSSGVVPTCVAIQSFEGGDSWSFTATPSAYNVSSDIWGEVSGSYSGLDPTDGSSFWVMRDLNNSNGGGNFFHELSFAAQNIAGYTSTSISFDYEVVGWDNGDDLEYEVFEDGISQGIVTLINGNSNLDEAGTVTINLTPGILMASFNIRATQDGGSDYGFIDNIRICGIAPSGCTPTHYITSFLPTSGPAGTHVTLSGSGFTGATSASLSGTNANIISVVDDNTIVVEIPENAASGSIGVTVAGCEAISPGTFTLITDDGDCGSSGGGGSFASDLFISEVYDANSGSLSYVEVFNGTNAAIADLTSNQYVIRIQTGTSNIDDYPMTGSLASGDTYILRVGTGTICSGITPDDDQPSASGFNGDDNIYLRKNGTVLDDVPNPNVGSGFSQSRNADVTSPTATYNPSEWTIGNDEVCEDLGVPPFIPNGSDITINSQPADVDCSALTFSVDATGNPDLASFNPYVWRYNAPGTDTWELVSSLNGSNGITVTGSGTSSITITGTTADLIDYQFYVDISADGSPQCTKASNAAQFTYDTRTFYRTVGSGDWTNIANWEMSNTEGSGYVAACQYPLESNSDKVIILPGHSLSFDDIDIAIDELEIELSGTLTIETSGELFIGNGNPSGTDLFVLGTLEDKGVSPNGIEFSTDATWELGVDGTIVKTNTSSVTNYRDNYESGIANIPATSNWIYRREGTNEVSVASTGMYYPNLTFENFGSGVYNPSNPQRFFQGSSDRPIIKGNLDIGGSGTAGYVVRTNNTNSAPILVQGELIIRAQSTFTNADDGGSNDGTGIEVQGDITIEGGGLELDEGSAGRGILLLSGSGDQLGVGDGQNIIVNEFEINKTNGEFYTDFSMIVSREARFVEGIYAIDDGAMFPADVEFSIGSSATDMSNVSFVDGQVVKFGNTDFVFPIGDTDVDGNNFYQPLRMFNLPQTGGYEARYFAEESPNAGQYYDGDSNNPFDFQEIGNCDYWFFNRISGTSNPRIGVAYSNTDEEEEYCNDVNDLPTLRISSFNGLSWDPINSAVSGSYVESGVAINTPDGGDYGEIALSSGNQANVLPITLLSFLARAEDGRVRTSWVTASETNNDYFTIERSKDGEFWEKIGTIDGAGNSTNELSYRFTDDRPYTGISYYRLRQTDFDGAFTVSTPRAVEILASGEFALDRVYRGQDGLNLIYRSTAPYLVVEIYDLLGKRVHGELLENYGSGFGTVYPDIARGAYLLRISHGSEFDTEKFVY